MTTEHCDVLVVGAGPVGLILALLLHKQGVNVKIVERQKALYPLPRAVALDHEARRIIGSVGLSAGCAEVLENIIGKGGEDGTNFVWRDADMKLVADLYMERPTRSGFPFACGFHQPDLEGLLEKAVLERGIPLIRGYAVCGLTQFPDRVEVQFEQFTTKAVCSGDGVVVNGVLKSNITPTEPASALSSPPNGTTNGLANGNGGLSVHASYVVGCDGANSTVRRLEQFTNTDLNFENDWLIADLILRDGYLPPLPKKIGSAQVCDPTRPTTLVFAGRDRQRFEFMRLPGETHEELLHEDKLWQLLERWGFNRDNCYLARKVIYSFRARWANEFYKGRVTLAGDSLHLMPPFIGQGLNSGFRDAAALAWRLPLLISGLGTPEKLLKSYETERMPHIEQLTRACIHLGEAICETDPAKSVQIHAKLRAKPLTRLYDPPLGQPGVLTTQPEAGNLALQRELKFEANPGEAKTAMFDDIHGYGWMLLNVGATSIEDLLSPESRAFFLHQLQGKCVTISHDQDCTGEYQEWLADHMAINHVVLVRPDFYVFGHAPEQDIDSLVAELQLKICSS